MNMRYTINEWCATCGKAKQYSGVLSDDPSTFEPEMCECNNTVSVRPVNTAYTASPYIVTLPGVGLEQAEAIRASYRDTLLTNHKGVEITPPQFHIAPESMQELETMVRRVVAEELAKRHPGE